MENCEDNEYNINVESAIRHLLEDNKTLGIRKDYTKIRLPDEIKNMAIVRERKE